VYLHFDVTTPGTSKTITITDSTGVDGFIVSATDSINLTVIDKTITGHSTKDIVIAGTVVSTGTAGHNVVWTGYRSFQITTVTTQVLTYTTLTGLNATTTYANGPDISIGTGAGVELSNVTLTYNLVGMQATSGWLVAKDASSNFTVYGILTSESASAGYQAGDITGSLTVKNADAYSASFPSAYTLGANAPTVTTVTVNASTSLVPATYTLTHSGAMVINGSVGGATAWAHDANGSVTINAGGTLIGARTFNFSGASFVVTGTFTNNTTAMIWDGAIVQAHTGAFTVDTISVTNTNGMAFTSVTINGAGTIQLTASDCKVECVSCSFNILKVNCVSSGAVISKTHNTTANDWRLVLAEGSSFSKSSITNDMASTDNVTLHSDYGASTVATFVCNENGNFNKIVLNDSYIALYITSGKRMTPNNGGTWDYDNVIQGASGTDYPLVTLSGPLPCPFIIIQHCTVAGTFDRDFVRLEDCKASYHTMMSIQECKITQPVMFKVYMNDVEL
jgi:hypothetical protein